MTEQKKYSLGSVSVVMTIALIIIQSIFEWHFILEVKAKSNETSEVIETLIEENNFTEEELKLIGRKIKE